MSYLLFGFFNAPERSTDIFLFCVIADEMPACPERGDAGRADAAERVEHDVALKSVQLDAAVWKLDRERGGMPYPRRRLGRKIPDALCVQ